MRQPEQVRPAVQPLRDVGSGVDAEGRLTVLGLVPARGGSKGVPRKNALRLGHQPLLAYTAESALAARRLARVVLSTDDPEIASLGRQHGLDVPFPRPADLAGDQVPMILVVRHVLDRLGLAGEHYGAVCLLQPTVPFREPGEIDDCISLLESSGADSVVTVRPVPAEFNPHWAFERNGGGWLRVSTGEAHPIARRQDLPEAYVRDGSVYVTRSDVLESAHSVLGPRVAGHVVRRSAHVNIDNPADWAEAQRLAALLRRGRT